MRRLLGTVLVIAAVAGLPLLTGAPAAADFAPVQRFDDDDVESFHGLDCPEPDTCFVVGQSYFDDEAGAIDINRSINGRIATIRDGVVGEHQRAYDTLRLSDIACWSGTDCVAVGYRLQDDRYVIQEFDDGDPTDFHSLPLGVEVGHVACQSGGRCFAVGNGVVELDDGDPVGYWSDPAVRELYDVDCPSEDWCLAGGLTPSPAEAVLVEIVDDDPQPPRSVPAIQYLTALDCWGEGGCVAGGDGEVARIVDGVVTVHPGPAMRYFAMACPSSTRCYGVGDWGNQPAIVGILDGVPQPLVTRNGPFSGIWSDIHCFSIASCTLVGFAGFGFIVQEMPTSLSSIAVTTSASPASPTAPPTLTAIVTGGDGSGSVRFMQASEPANDEISRHCHSQPLVPIGGDRYRATCTPPVPPDFNELHVGTYSIITRYTGDREALASESAPITQVVRLAQTVTFEAPPAPTYGDPDIQLAASASSGLPVGFSSSTADVCTVSAGGLLHIEGAGACTVTARQPGDDTYAPASTTRTITVIKALLTVTAHDATRHYGTADPTFAAGIDGFVLDDTAEVVSGAPVLTTTATPTSPPGTYPIAVDVSGMEADDYTFAAVAGTLTVSPAPTAATVSVAPDPSSLNEAVTVTATVTSPATLGDPPSGTVTFHVDGAQAATAPLAGGVASARLLLPGGTHTVTAAYSGDGNFLGSDAAPKVATVTCTRTITGTHRGSVQVPSGTTCVLPGATIRGSISVAPGASLSLDGATVTGPVTADAPSAIRICGTSSAAVTITGASGFVLVGGPEYGCAGNTVRGPLRVTGGRGGLVVVGNRSTGPLTATDNRGAGPLPGQEEPVISGNRR